MHQTQYNAPKHEFRVQWGGFGVFVAKDPDVTSWHELLHYAMLQNMSLRSNGVDWGAFVVKNPDVTSWHELLY